MLFYVELLVDDEKELLEIRDFVRKYDLKVRNPNSLVVDFNNDDKGATDV
jgi:hypothetical protein